MTGTKSEVRRAISFSEMDSLNLNLRDYIALIMNSLVEELKAFVPCDERYIATRISLVRYNEVPIGIVITKTHPHNPINAFVSHTA